MNTVTATTRIEALHHWPDATPHRAYLAHDHRHLFGLTAVVTVEHSNRAVEFHDLQDDLFNAAYSLTTAYHPRSIVRDFGARSCEDIAEGIAQTLTLDGYDVRCVAVDEDTEHTGTWTPQED